MASARSSVGKAGQRQGGLQHAAFVKKRVTLAAHGGECRVAYGRYGRDGAAVVFQPETIARQNFPVTLLVQVGKAAREFDLRAVKRDRAPGALPLGACGGWNVFDIDRQRSEEHTSELQSRENLVCRLLLEKKKQISYINL